MRTLRNATFFGSSLCTMLLASAAPAAAPCDFVTGSPKAFTWEHVKQCYESVPFRADDLSNIVSVIEQHRSFSDLAEIYDARIHWRENLHAVGRATYASDFAMHEALKAEHKEFRNAHVGYMPPGCYWRMVNALVPFDFGVTTRFVRQGEKQLVFIEDTPYLADEYQQFTGIDVRQFVGMKVVSINRTPTLDYFRTFGREAMKDHEDDGGHLNAIVNRAGYSVRIGSAGDSIPDRAADEYVFESRRGVRTRVQIPWMFVPSSLIFGDAALPLTHSSAEFRDSCLRAPSAPFGTSSATGLPGPIWQLGVPGEYRKHWAAWARRSHRYPSSAGFFEVPPEERSRDVETVIPLTGSAEVLQYRRDTTVLRVHDTIGWIDVAREGIAYACEHSQRLIVDVRSNNGGNDTVIEWLHRHLFPKTESPVPSGKLPIRVRNDNEAFNEMLFNMAAFDALAVPLGAEPCSIGVGPGCIVDVNTGGPLGLDELEWFSWPRFVELRGWFPVSLSRQVGLPDETQSVSFDAAECAGRFAGRDLVFLTDGSNASGGYFLPSAFKGDGVLVTVGGFVGEPMAMGRARGGSTVPGSTWATLANIIPALTGGALTFTHEYPALQREVDSYIEMTGAYRKDRRTLHIDRPVDSDLFVDVWSDSPWADGYVYRRVLEAVNSGGRWRARRP